MNIIVMMIINIQIRMPVGSPRGVSSAAARWRTWALCEHGSIFRRRFSSIRLMLLDVPQVSSIFFDLHAIS